MIRRDGGLDALRATMTLLVVFHHSALTYGAIGGWYYREVPTDGRLDTKLLILFCTVNQAYFMGLFFLIAGYLTPGAVARKGISRYLRDRLLRLGLPLLFYVLLISPLTIALAQTARGRPFDRTFAYLWTHGQLEAGPLWFAQVLLIFCFFYLAWRRFSGRDPPIRRFPSNVAMALAALATGAAAFAIRLVWPVGMTPFGLQLGYFASYMVLFAAGCAGASARWLEMLPASQRRFWLIVAWITLPVLPLVTEFATVIPALRGDTSGGWNIQAVVYAFWEPLVAWGFIMGLLHAFERRMHSPGATWRALARRAYAMFIIHPPILVAVALAWRSVPAPHLIKFAMTGTATCLACYWLAGLLLRVPAVRPVV
jgi:fucose 4-O-acetylase-like acetyltransferase